MKKESEIIEEFRTSIRNGTGRAYLLMKKNSSINFTKELFKASYKNFAYDGQSEGDRTTYLIQFLKLLSNKDLNNYKSKIVKKLYKEKNDTWSLLQLFNLTAYLAKKDEAVKIEIYNRFRQTPISDSDWLGTDAILRLDGVDGMIQIAEHFGKRLIFNSDELQDDSLANSFDEDHPELAIKQRLEKEALSNKYIKKYLEEIKATRQRWNTNNSKKTNWTTETIVEHISDDNKRRPPFPVLRNLSKSQIIVIAKLLQDDPNLNQQEKLLQVFRIVKYPNEIVDLKPFLKTGNSKNIRDDAFEALCFFRDTKLRKISIEKLPKSKNPSKYLEAFKMNYEKGDSKLITKAIDRFSDEETIESIAVTLCKIYKENKTKDCKKPLLALYEKMNCALHRKKILELLHKNKVLPNKILREMKYDCNEDTRKLYSKIKKKSK